MNKHEVGDSLNIVVSTLRKVLDERYEEEYKASTQITDQIKLDRLTLYLETRRAEEEKIISDFNSLCKRSLFGGRC